MWSIADGAAGGAAISDAFDMFGRALIGRNPAGDRVPLAHPLADFSHDIAAVLLHVGGEFG
jgi:hypothetical protein